MENKKESKPENLDKYNHKNHEKDEVGFPILLIPRYLLEHKLTRQHTFKEHKEIYIII